MNETLYHYTPQVGLRGIADSGHLWATKIQYLNDHSEFKLAFEDARIHLAVRKKREPSESVQKWIEETLERLEGFSGFNVFVASFSEDGNLLSQWRAYSKGQIGYSLGFAKESLQKAAQAQPGMTLEKCIYDPSVSNIRVGKMAEEFVVKLREFAVQNDAKGAQSAIAQFSVEIAFISPLFKHPKFHEEKEWRLILKSVRNDAPEVFCRDGTHGLVPTFRIDLRGLLSKAEVEVIYVGPSPDERLALSGLSTFLAGPEIKIRVPSRRPCGIPYRNT